ncbi:MAG: hypothetical protein K2N72_03575 [Oscillospiraceae bacterium]|nr:hypothetical protein [Oscillospiraceae bacterium]
MGNFKRAARIIVLSGKHKIVASGVIAAVILNTLMIFADTFNSGTGRIWVSMAMMSLAVPSMIGNADILGLCRAVTTSKLRKYIYGKFYTIMTVLSALLVYAAEFAARLAASGLTKDMTAAENAGEESIMIALILCIGIINTGMLSLGKYGLAVYIGSGAFVLAIAGGIISVPFNVPELASGNHVFDFILGAAIIIAGAAVQYFIRRKCYKKQSYPWGKNAPEEMAELLGK